MRPLSIFLFDDAGARRWQPFTLTRPAGELLFGALFLRERAERMFGGRVREHLSGRPRCAASRRRGLHPCARSARRVARATGCSCSPERFRTGRSETGGRHRCSAGPVAIGGVVAGWFAPEGSPAPEPAFLEDPTGWNGDPVVQHRGARAGADLGAALPQRRSDHRGRRGSAGRAGTAIGDAHRRSSLGRSPAGGAPERTAGAGLRHRHHAGPVWLDERSVVRAFTRLCGPAYVGPRSHLLGGSVECVSIGPVCRIRGEISPSHLPRLHQQAARRAHGPRLPRALGEPGRRDHQQRPQEQLRLHPPLDAGRRDGYRRDEARLAYSGTT